jgi:hypothetical protein
MADETSERPDRESRSSPIDIHVGSRVRLRRTLFDISRVLDVPISFFFDDMPEGMSETPVSGPRGRMYGFAEAQEPFSSGVDDQLSKRETLELVRAYYRITDPGVRKRMFDLMKSLAPVEGTFETT